MLSLSGDQVDFIYQSQINILIQILMSSPQRNPH